MSRREETHLRKHNTAHFFPLTVHRTSVGVRHLPPSGYSLSTTPWVHKSASPTLLKMCSSSSSLPPTSFLEHIVKESIAYPAEMMGEAFERWQPYTVDELCAYMGFMILMGMVKLPTIRDYWKKDASFHYSPVASKISRKQFYNLHRYLHFADNRTPTPPGSPGYDKLGKVAPIKDDW